jgi:hypothetical protein
MLVLCCQWLTERNFTFTINNLNVFFMKNLEVNVMHTLVGGVDCRAGAQLARVAGAAVGGAIFFGFGALLTTFGMVMYNGFACADQPMSYNGGWW